MEIYVSFFDIKISIRWKELKRSTRLLTATGINMYVADTNKSYMDNEKNIVNKTQVTFSRKKTPFINKSSIVGLYRHY